MALVTSHSFRRILMARILLLLMPMLCISEWMVYQQARRSLLENAQSQAQEIAAARTASLALEQMKLQAGFPSTAPVTQRPSDPATCPATAPQCQQEALQQEALQPYWQSILTQPAGAIGGASRPLLALVDAQGKLLGHSEVPGASQGRCQTDLAETPDCALLAALQAPASQGGLNDLPKGLSRNWIIGSSTVQLSGPAEPTSASASDARGASDGRLVVALPAERVLAPLRNLSHWMVGATLMLAGLSAGVALYLSRELARPVEELRDRLLMVQQQLSETSLGAHQTLTSDRQFDIRELQQLAGAFDQLIDCLNQRTTALERATEEAHAASKMKSEFLAATSHELRTPLNALIGHLRLIQDGYCDSAQETALCLGQADQAALHLLKVLNELLDIARIEAGNFEFQIQSFDLLQLIEEVLEMERSHSIQKQLTLSLKASQRENLERCQWVEADRDKLKQVILNVVANAIKFTDCGSITLELNLERRSQQPQRLILSVTDTGIGIDPGQQRQLFQPFARAGAAKNQYEGSGLGLAISRTLMERMGGEIHLISHGIGQGTTVKIILPLPPQPVDGAIAPSLRATMFPSPARPQGRSAARPQQGVA